MKTTRVLVNTFKTLIAGAVLGGAGLVLKNQQDDITTLRQKNGALATRVNNHDCKMSELRQQHENELATLREKEEALTKQLTVAEKENKKALADGLAAAREDISKKIATAQEENRKALERGLATTTEKLHGTITKIQEKNREDLERGLTIVKEENKKATTAALTEAAQKRTKMIQRVKHSVVDIGVLLPESLLEGSLTGSIIDIDRKGELAVLTAGHFTDKESDVLKTTFKIYIREYDLCFTIQGSKLKKGLIPWSHAKRRDFTIIRLDDDMQALLNKLNIKPLPFLSPTKQLLKGEDLVPIVRRGRVLKGIINDFNFYFTKEGLARTDYLTDTPIVKGDSGAPILNLDGEILGIASWGYTPKVRIQGPEEIVDNLRIEIDALTGFHFFVSRQDLLRGLGSIGYPLTKEEKGALLRTDLLQAHPELLTIPSTSTLEALTYLGKLSTLEKYAFK